MWCPETGSNDRRHERIAHAAAPDGRCARPLRGARRLGHNHGVVHVHRRTPAVTPPRPRAGSSPTGVTGQRWRAGAACQVARARPRRSRDQGHGSPAATHAGDATGIAQAAGRRAARAGATPTGGLVLAPSSRVHIVTHEGEDYESVGSSSGANPLSAAYPCDTARTPAAVSVPGTERERGQRRCRARGPSCPATLM